MTDPNPQIPDGTQNPSADQPSEEYHPLQEEHPPQEERPPQEEHPPQEEQTQNPPNPQSPETLTLSDQAPLAQQDQDTLMEDPILNADNPELDAPATAPSTVAGVRRGPKRKKFAPKRTAQERKSREKLQVLVETLKPIPFVPSKALDFPRHQSLLQRLGLWDFVHIEFDAAIRGDLISELIASYAPANRCSYVSGVRINVNRADLARALKLPVKKGAVPVVNAEEGEEERDLGESISFVNDLVSNWMLLHDDAYIMPNEVLGCVNLIRDGQLEKVDWAGLMWNMVEKELRAPQLVNCYYASHLQQLIKSQREELLAEPPRKEEEEEEDGVKGEEEEDEEEEEEVVGEEVDGSGDVNMGGVDDEDHACELEEHKIELSLGQDNIERVEEVKEQLGGDQIMDFDPSKVVEEAGMWLFDQKNNVGEPFLRQCHSSDVKVMDCDHMKEDEGEEGQEQEEEDEDDEDDEHEDGFHLSHKGIPMVGMASGTGSLMQAMEVGQMTFSSGIDLRDNPGGDFLSARDHPQIISGNSLFGNGHKREIDMDNHNPHHSLNGNSKRLRTESPWNSKPVDFEMCMEQIEDWAGKARMVFAAKEQAHEESSMNQQLLLNELQQRDNMIDELHKSKLDEMRRREMEVYRLEKELYTMTSLVEGYRKALKETQKGFAEYRARFPQADEPLYKDVPGSGGLVLSVMEFEKERLRKEEEERMKLREFMRDFEKKCRDIEGNCIGELEGHMSRVESLGAKLLAVEDQVKNLKGANAKSKVSDPECAPASEEQTA